MKGQSVWHHGLFTLTHWGQVTHICVGKLTITGSDNGLSPGRCQTIIRTSAGILLIGPLRTNFSEILNGIETFSFKKMLFKRSYGKCQQFWLGLNVLITSYGQHPDHWVLILGMFFFLWRACQRSMTIQLTQTMPLSDCEVCYKLYPVVSEAGEITAWIQHMHLLSPSSICAELHGVLLTHHPIWLTRCGQKNVMPSRWRPHCA